MRSRPDIADFEVGGVDRHDYTGQLAEFIGTALMFELDGEDVGLMRWLDGSGYIVATIQSWDYGETFTRVHVTENDALTA